MNWDWMFQVVAAATAINTALLAAATFFAPRIAARFKAAGDLAAAAALADKTAKRCDVAEAEHGRFREETRLELDRVRLKSDETARAVAALKNDVRDGFADLKDDVRDGLGEVKQRLDLFLQAQQVALTNAANAAAAPRRRRARRAAD